MPQRTIPAEESTRDLAKTVKNLFRTGSYNDLLLEALAQYDPQEQVLADHLTQKEKVSKIVSKHEIPKPMRSGIGVDFDLELDSEQDMADSEEAVTT